MNRTDCRNCGGDGFSIEGGDCPACKGTGLEQHATKQVPTRDERGYYRPFGPPPTDAERARWRAQRATDSRNRGNR